MSFDIEGFDSFDVKHVLDHVNLFSVFHDYFPLMVVLVRYFKFALLSCGDLVL